MVSAKMSEKRARLSNHYKLAILEAVKKPGYEKDEIRKEYKIGKQPYTAGLFF